MELVDILIARVEKVANSNIFADLNPKKFIAIEESDYPINAAWYKSFECSIARPIPPWIYPNHLTYLRLFLCIFLLIFSKQISYACILLITLIGGLTDLLDGALARSNNRKTKLGTILDPFADKLLIFILISILLIRNDINTLYLLFIIGFETHILFIPLMSYLYQWHKNGTHQSIITAGEKVQPIFIGRVKLHFYIYALLLMLLGKIFRYSILIELSNVCFISGITLASIAYIQYLLRWAKDPH